MILVIIGSSQDINYWDSFCDFQPLLTNIGKFQDPSKMFYIPVWVMAKNQEIFQKRHQYLEAFYPTWDDKFTWMQHIYP